MRLRTATSNKGGVLVITIVICALVGLMLTAYLSMVSSQHTFTQRSQVWNNTIPLCEAGIEQAMAHINHSSVSSNLGINGWTSLGPGRGFTNWGNLNGGTYTMHLDNVWPPLIRVWGTLNQSLGNGTVTRGVEVRTKVNQRFPAAVLAKGTVNLDGSGVIDSFNSTNSTDNISGQYHPSVSTAVAMVGTTLRSAGAINVGNMKIHGFVATGPDGTAVVGATGVVGDKAYATDVASNKQTIQDGHHIDDANFYIPPASLPTDFNVTLAQNLFPRVLPGYVYNGTNYKYAILADGDYKAPSISLRNGEKMLILAKARLLVSGFTIVQHPDSYILIETNASIEWFAGGLIDISGGAAINRGGYAINLSFVCLSSAGVTYQGNGGLVGTIYAPQSSVFMNGTSDAIGAITCNDFTLRGTMGIHYDEALRANPKIRFLADSWREL